MPHVDARLTIRGRLPGARVREEGWAVAQAAKAMGISRQCAHLWLARYDQHGVAGLGEVSARVDRAPARAACRPTWRNRSALAWSTWPAGRQDRMVVFGVQVMGP